MNWLWQEGLPTVAAANDRNSHRCPSLSEGTWLSAFYSCLVHFTFKTVDEIEVEPVKGCHCRSTVRLFLNFLRRILEETCGPFFPSVNNVWQQQPYDHCTTFKNLLKLLSFRCDLVVPFLVVLLLFVLSIYFCNRCIITWEENADGVRVGSAFGPPATTRGISSSCIVR